MSYFTKDFLKFTKELRKNNNRDWFNKNKTRFIEDVKEPFEVFVQAMIDEYRKVNPSIAVTPKECIFRIYRDTRFSKDKTPYKEHVSAIISPGGRKNMSTPGMYIQMNDIDVRLYSGVYKPDKDQLHKIRTAIASDLKGFKKLISKKAFIDTFGEIRGEKNKRLPKEFMEAAEVQPLIFNKGFYYFASLDPNIVLEKNLPKTLMKHYKVAQPVSDFLMNAIK